MEKHNTALEAQNSIESGLAELNISVPTQFIGNYVELLMDFEQKMNVEPLDFLDVLKIIVWTDQQKQQTFMEAVSASERFGSAALNGYNSTTQELEEPNMPDYPQDEEVEDFNPIGDDGSDFGFGDVGEN